MPRHPYELDSAPLGVGGFGIVTRATHRTSGQLVALKQALPGEAAALRMKREIDVQVGLSHRNIMPVLDHDPSHRWFTMPIAAASFADRYRRVPPSNVRLAQILLDIGAALQYAHYRGHVHRDVTPSNILLIPDGASGHRWVLADWGLVQPPTGQEALPLTLAGQVLGTHTFGPPEMLTTPSGVGAEVDIYYLGALVAWVLTGEAPSHEHMPSPDDSRWAEFVTAMTPHHAHERPQSMLPVLAALHAMRDEFAAEQRVRGQHQSGLFRVDGCGTCGREASGMRCVHCGAFLTHYN